MNLIQDTWIPVRLRDGSQRVIAPYDMAQPDVMFPDWPRPDFNLACLELLIGLVFLADPPRNARDRHRRLPTVDGLRDAMVPLVPAFNLTGDGPKFLQDFTGFNGGSLNDPDMLFMDSAGGQTVKFNKDLMVHANRYPELNAPMAAMALYTLQNFAPSGGAGNRTSMRGGGPLVTLVKPKGANLLELVWANVPIGEPIVDLTALPWMRPIPAADEKSPWPDPMAGQDGTNAEVFFGQPRRLQLMFRDGVLTTVNQSPYGNNYVDWRHPLSPYYLVKGEWLPKHPKPGALNYSAWMGLVYETPETALAPRVIQIQREVGQCHVLAGGWAMSNMAPQDFLWAEVPVFNLSADQLVILGRMIDGGVMVARAVAGAVSRAMGEDSAYDGHGLRAQTAFYQTTEPALIALIQRMVDQGADSETLCGDWLDTHLRPIALDLFQKIALSRVLSVSENQRKCIVEQGNYLRLMVMGYSKSGADLFKTLNLPQPNKKGVAA